MPCGQPMPSWDKSWATASFCINVAVAAWDCGSLGCAGVVVASCELFLVVLGLLLWQVVDWLKLELMLFRIAGGDR